MSNVPNAPSLPFAKRVATFEVVRGFYHPVDTSAIISDLITACREQQAALQDLLQNESGMVGYSDAVDQARAVLTKYALCEKTLPTVAEMRGILK